MQLHNAKPIKQNETCYSTTQDVIFNHYAVKIMQCSYKLIAELQWSKGILQHPQ